MGVLSGAAALGGGLAGLFGGGGANSVPVPQAYNMQQMAGADSNAYSGIGQLNNYNTYGQGLGQASTITNNLVNNPYAGQYQQGTNQASGLGQLQALGQYGAGQGLQQGANQVMNTAFDPQQALYNQTYSQNQQQQAAMAAQSGVGTTPYGQGVQDQANTNFNTAWQAQQLQNQIGGLNAATNASQSGQQMAAAAPGQYATASALPYGTFNTLGQGQIGALGQLGQFGQSASTLPQQTIQDYLAYLGQGTTQQSANNQTAQVGLNQNNMAFQQNQAYGKAIGSGLSGLGSSGMGWGNFA